MRYIEDHVVSSIITANARPFIDHLISRLTEIAHDESKAWVKPKVIYEDPIHPNDGDIRTMTCFTDQVKVIKIISTNPLRKRHWSVSVGMTVLLDYDENHPVMMFDAPMMSALRTAGMAIVSSMLSGYDFHDTGIVGAGRVGSYTKQLIELAFPGQSSIEMYDIKDGTAGPDTLYDNRVLITATTSREPFITRENCHADFVCSVGADTAFNFELTDEFLRRRNRVFVDCPDAARVGDINRCGKNNYGAIRGGLYDLVTWDPGESGPDTFISVGSPLMDALTVEFLIQHV